MALPDYKLLFPTEEHFLEALNASGLASLPPDQLQDERHSLIPQLRQFIERIHDVGDDPEFSVISRWIGDGVNGKAINCFGSDYSEFRAALMAEDRIIFDELFAPLRLEDEFDFKSLDYGGLATLFWIGFRAVVSPQRCEKLSHLGKTYSVTTLFGLLANLSDDLSPAIKRLLSRRADLDDDGWSTLLARYQSVGCLWAVAHQFAARKKRVFVALLEA